MGTKTGIEGLPQSEAIFVLRMLPHFMAGKSVEEAAKAVLEDDARLFSALSVGDEQVWCGDILGTRSRSANPAATGLRAALTQHVYETLRAA